MTAAAPPPDALARWQRVSAWLDQALDRDPAQRGAWRADLARQDPPPEPALLAELDALLAAHATALADDPLAAPPVLGPRPALPQDTGPQPGQRVGPWELVACLGQGGMAAVWRARRVDGAYQRMVALKLPHRLPWRADLAARLARERDILARLAHPHIARLYDAGVAAAEPATPWLAMELVDGQPITDWCDARRLPPADRVRLFLQVLDAVAHAHALLVLHRDLKPSNILVNAEGQVRLLDFGIAKLLDEEGDEGGGAALTQFGNRALTPEYASPEQLRGDPLTTASDVYSLAVVLYELLCGAPPYRLRHRSAAQLETAILETPPPRPSADPQAGPAQARGVTPRHLARTLRGELDAIVLMALRKSPDQRFRGAAEFRDDLQRWLDGRQVQAQPDSWHYRLGVFVRRHRAGVAMAAGAAALLLATTAVSLHQRQIARREAERAGATRDFLLGLYKPVSWLGGNPARGGQVTARELLDLSARQLRDHPSTDPDVQRDLLSTLGDLYADAGSRDGELAASQSLVAYVREQVGPRTPAMFDALVRLSLAQNAFDSTRAEATLAQATPLRPPAGGEFDASLARYWLSLGNLTETRDAATAEHAFGEAIRVTSGAPALRLLASRGLIGLARVRWFGQGRLSDAAELYRRALALLHADPSTPRFALTKPEVELAEVESRLGHYDRAGALLDTAYQRSLEGLGPTAVDTVQVGLRKAVYLSATGRAPQALALLTQLQRAVLAVPGMAQDVATLPALRQALSDVESLLGRFQDAQQHIALAVDGLSRREGARPSTVTVQWLAQWAQTLAQLGRAAEARATLVRVDRMQPQVQATPWSTRMLAMRRARVEVLAQTNAADALAAQGALDAWSRAEEAVIAAWTPPAQARARATIAIWRAEAGLFGQRPDVALAQAQQALDDLDDAVIAEVGRTEQAQALGLRAEAWWRMGQASQACAAQPRAAALLAEVLPGSVEQGLMQHLADLCRPGARGRARGAAVLAIAPWRARRRAMDPPVQVIRVSGADGRTGM